MLKSVLIAVTIVVAAGPARAAEQNVDDQEVTEPREIVLTVTANEVAAQRAALRAAKALGYQIAWETTFEVPERRQYLGRVIAARRAGGGRIVVSSYLGDQADIDEPLREARRAFPAAKAIAVTLPAGVDTFDGPFYLRGVLVVSSHRSYAAAVRAAKSYGRAAGITYDSRGMVFYDKRGLIWPDDDEDEMWAGRYAPRREDTEGCPSGCVTVERSSAYPDFKRALYIVVAGIVDREEASERLAFARRFAPDAYIKETILYMGCMH